MNLGTMRTRILRALFQDQDTTEQKILDDVNNAIVESIRHLSFDRYPFNQRDFIINVVDGQSSYDLPADYLAMTGKVYFTQDGGFTRVIDCLPIQQALESFGDIPNISSTAYIPGTASVPFIGIDGVLKKVILSPALNLSPGTISFRYIADVGMLSVIYESSAFVIKRGVETINSSTHTSPWFTEGFHLLLHRALHLLWSEVYGGTEESVMKSKVEYERYQEEVKRLNNVLSTSSKTTRHRGYI